MLLTLQVTAVFLVALTMGLALAHALEFPGKLRLDERTYLAVQTIYYPGFTIGGIGEPLAIVATLILTIAMRNDGAMFWWTLAAFVAVLATHVVFWLVTQPTNRYWLRKQQMGRAGTKFFAADAARLEADTEKRDWKRMRDQWEYSHVARAVLSAIALLALIIAVAA